MIKYTKSISPRLQNGWRQGARTVVVHAARHEGDLERRQRDHPKAVGAVQQPKRFQLLLELAEILAVVDDAGRRVALKYKNDGAAVFLTL